MRSATRRQDETCGGYDAFDLYYLEGGVADDECQEVEVLPYEQVRPCL